jgi:hypothetical protein
MGYAKWPEALKTEGFLNVGTGLLIEEDVLSYDKLALGYNKMRFFNRDEAL